MRRMLFALLVLLASGAGLRAEEAEPRLAMPCAAFGEPEGAPYVCSCDAAAAEGTVWGTDVYTADSNVCTAARHAGAPEGAIRVTPRRGQQSFAGSTRNGVTTEAYGPFDRAFTLAPVTLDAPQACPPSLAQADNATLPGLSLRCLCSAAATSQGTVWGTDIYSSDSGLCRAARHAGAVGAAGGEVLVTFLPGLDAFTGTRRNGVDSEAFTAWPVAMRFPRAVASLPTCPPSLADRPMSAGPLTCLCPAEYAADRQAEIWGTDLYTRDSALCRAAVHYGAVPVTGGRITMLLRPGQPAYAATRRNGVASIAFAAYHESYTFEGPPRGDVQPDVPVGAPIAETLKARGQVALYIRFRSDSAELDAASTPALEELRDALRADPGLRLRLVGHTDNTGQAARNRTLSQQRAQAVQRWLVGQGIATVRLTTDGKGPDEPIADNATEGGRAVNRRTQAIRL